MTGISRICFTLLLSTSFCRASQDERQTDTEEIFKTPRDKTVQSDFSGSKFHWNCTYKVNSTSGFRSGRVTKDMLDNGRLFSVYVKYKLYDQDDRETEYINQAFFRSIVNGTKSWHLVEAYLKSTSVINTRTSADYDIFPSLLLEPEENLDRFDYSSERISLTLSLFTTDLMLGFVTFMAFIFYHSY